MATVLHPPPDRSAAETMPKRGEDVGGSAHSDHAAEEIPQPRWLESLLLFAIATGVYFYIGYHAVVEDGVVVFDALDRLTRAHMGWHNETPKLAAIGFVFPPLTTMLFLPFQI